ncbi:uncharacterized protein DS421_16g560130 [Arachis hypogaea]|nr:uncharacterized protein DS421_16g560130 [Arachis hypogaea]
MGDDPARLYRLDGVAHIAGVINDEPQRCIRSMRRQQGMRFDDRYVPYLQMAGLYHLARMNDRWFRLDEALVSAFVERWRPETHTFHMSFGECTITLQDVAYQLGLPVDGRYVSGCLSEFHIYIQGGRPAWVWFQELLGVVPPPNQETFGECPEGADDETVRRYARAYIMMLLGTQLFADKSGNRIHIRWLPYVARLEEMGTYSWGSAALTWLYRCMCRVANRHVVKLAGPLQLLQSWIFWRFPRFRPEGYETFSWPLASRWSGYNPSGSEKGPRVQMWRLRIDQLHDKEFIWMPYTTPDILQVVHPKALEPRHMALWRSVTSLIYFAVIEWHQIDRVLPQFGGVQPCPNPALNIDFLMSKDGRGGDRWFSYQLQKWHLYWDSRADTVLKFDVVADPGPSQQFLDWWRQHGKMFLSPEMQLMDPRAIPIPVEASQRGAGVSGGGLMRLLTIMTMTDPLEADDEAREGDGEGVVRGTTVLVTLTTMSTISMVPWAGMVQGAVAVHGVSTHNGGQGGEWYGSGMGDVADPGHAGLGSGPLGDYFVGVPAHDQPQQEGTPWVITGSQWSDFLASDTLDADFGGEQFLDDITAIMQEDVPARRRGQTFGTQAPLDIDLNEPPTASVGDHFGLGGTPPSAYAAASESVAGQSAAPAHFTPPTQPGRMRTRMRSRMRSRLSAEVSGHGYPVVAVRARICLDESCIMYFVS